TPGEIGVRNALPVTFSTRSVYVLAPAGALLSSHPSRIRTADTIVPSRGRLLIERLFMTAGAPSPSGTEAPIQPVDESVGRRRPCGARSTEVDVSPPRRRGAVSVSQPLPIDPGLHHPTRPAADRCGADVNRRPTAS